MALHWTKSAGSLSVLPQLKPETDVSLHINAWMATEEEIKVEKKGITTIDLKFTVHRQPQREG